MSKTKLALMGLSLSMLLPSLDTSIANVGLPTLAQAFNATFHQVQWIVVAYLLAVTTLIVFAGRLGDLAGKRRMLLAGIAFFTLASIACGVAPTLAILIAARAAQGIGAAMMIALTLALVTESVPKEMTGTAMGLLGTMSAIGTAVGPSAGGLLIAAFGWRAMFLVNVPIGIIALLLVQRCVGQALSLSGQPERLPYTRQPERLSYTMLRDRSLSASLAMNSIVSTVMMSTLIVGPFYLSRALGLSAARVGVVMSAGPLVAALTGIPAGRIVDRWGSQRMTIVGLSGIASGAFLLSIMPARFGILGYIAPIVIMTADYALFQTANNTAVMTNVAADRRGAISGMLSLSRNVGLIAGASAMGAIFAHSGMHATFAVAAMLIVGGIGIGISAQRRQSNPICSTNACPTR